MGQGTQGPGAHPSARKVCTPNLWFFGLLEFKVWNLSMIKLGFFGFWFFGTCVCWFFGTLDFWFFGSLELWIFGSLELCMFGSYPAMKAIRWGLGHLGAEK